MSPPADAASPSISATTAAALSSTRISILGHHRLGRFQRRPVGGIAQQRLPDAFAEDAAPPRDAPIMGHSRSVPSRARRIACSPPGARSSDTACAGRDPDRRPRPARASPWRRACSVTTMSCWRAWACPLQRPRACDNVPGPQPSREASQPQYSNPDAPSPSETDGHAGDRGEVRPQRGRVEGRGDALAPRRRAQPREVHHVRVARRVGGALERAPRRPTRPASRSARSAPAARSASTPS